MADEQQRGQRRDRVYQVIGLIVGAVFLAVGVTSFLAGGGPIIALIALVGGFAVIIVSIVNMVRS